MKVDLPTTPRRRVHVPPIPGSAESQPGNGRRRRTTLHQTTKSSLDVWEHATGEFVWESDGANSVCVVAGKATVEMPDGRQVQLGPGRAIYLPRGTRSRWLVEEDVRLVAAKTR